MTPPSCVTWSSPGQRWRSSQPEHWGAQWWWVIRTHTDISFIISEQFLGNIRLICASQNAIAGYLELVSSERVSFRTSEGTVVYFTFHYGPQRLPVWLYRTNCYPTRFTNYTSFPPPLYVPCTLDSFISCTSANDALWNVPCCSTLIYNYYWYM